MSNNCQFSWQAVDALPLFSATIEVLLDEAERQHIYIVYLKNEANKIEEKLIGSVPFLVDLEVNASKGYHVGIINHRRVYHGRIAHPIRH